MQRWLDSDINLLNMTEQVDYDTEGKLLNLACPSGFFGGNVMNLHINKLVLMF